MESHMPSDSKINMVHWGHHNYYEYIIRTMNQNCCKKKYTFSFSCTYVLNKGGNMAIHLGGWQ